MNQYGHLRSIQDQKYREPCRDSKEVQVMFSQYFGSSTSFSNAVQRGNFPKPDLVVKSSGPRGKKLYWKISTLEKELKRKNSEAAK